jgi:hypothetical protein
MAIVGCWERELAAGLRVLRVASTSVGGWLKGDLPSWAFAMSIPPRLTLQSTKHHRCRFTSRGEGPLHHTRLSGRRISLLDRLSTIIFGGNPGGFLHNSGQTAHLRAQSLVLKIVLHKYSTFSKEAILIPTLVGGLCIWSTQAVPSNNRLERAIAGAVSSGTKGESMLEINQPRLAIAHPRIAQPHR